MHKSYFAFRIIFNGIAFAAVAAALFLALTNIGLIARSATQDFTFGG